MITHIGPLGLNYRDSKGMLKIYYWNSYKSIYAKKWLT